MATILKLSDELIELAKSYAITEHRSVAKQIEYWAQLGRLLRIIWSCQFNSSKMLYTLLQKQVPDNVLNIVLNFSIGDAPKEII